MKENEKHPAKPQETTGKKAKAVLPVRVEWSHGDRLELL